MANGKGLWGLLLLGAAAATTAAAIYSKKKKKESRKLLGTSEEADYYLAENVEDVVNPTYNNASEGVVTDEEDDSMGHSLDVDSGQMGV